MGTKTKTRDIGLESKPWIMIGTNTLPSTGTNLRINEDINMIKDEITMIKDNISIITLELSKIKCN